MTENLENPEVGMVVRNKHSGTMYQIAYVESDRVYMRPYWPGQSARSTWKTITRLWVDCHRIDETAVTEAQP